MVAFREPNWLRYETAPRDLELRDEADASCGSATPWQRAPYSSGCGVLPHTIFALPLRHPHLGRPLSGDGHCYSTADMRRKALILGTRHQSLAFGPEAEGQLSELQLRRAAVPSTTQGGVREVDSNCFPGLGVESSWTSYLS